MSIRKGLAGIVTAGVLALGAAGCSDYSAFNYNGKIGQDQVTFKQNHPFLDYSENILTVKRPDGKIIKYVDSKSDDLILEYVEITAHGIKTKYERFNVIEQPVLDEAQKQFDSYLKQIKELKIKPGLDNIR